MNKMQLPSRVVDVLAALKTQGYEMKFHAMQDGNICVDCFKHRDNEVYSLSFFLRHDIGFDMFDTEYKRMCDVVDPRVQKKSAAVLKYLEGIIEY